MLDSRYIRENVDKVREAVAAKQLDSGLVDKFLDIDNKRRELLLEVEELRARRNKLAKEKNIEEGKKVKDELKSIEPELQKLELEFEKALKSIPNVAAEDVKVGKSENENEVIRKWGEPNNFGFNVKDHLELGRDLDLIDTEQSAKASGSRFAYLKNDAVLLEFALINFAFESLTKEGFTPIIPPTMLRTEVFDKLGYSEGLGSEEYYSVHGGDKKEAGREEESEYYLIGTSEHSIVPYHMDNVFSASELPKRYVGFSTCFRREAGSYGKDTKGIFRLHQFDKVEMVSFVKPEDGDEEHDFLLLLEENMWQALGIPYQVVKMCTADLGFPAARKYDLEGWIPSQGKYREVTSTSTTTDYQARRLNIKYQDKGKTEFVHTLNGTAFAIGRTIIAILENYQQKDGSVLVPEILRKWVGKDIISH